MVIPKKLNITEPRIEKRISVKKAVNVPFFAISILDCLENLSVITIKIGAIPKGFIKVKKVVRQKIKN